MTPLLCRERLVRGEHYGSRALRLTSQVTFGVAIAAGMVLPEAQAEEWSMTPKLNWTVGQDSNPRLVRDAESSGSAATTLDLQFQRATENTSIQVAPHLRLQRFTDPDLGNNHDVSLTAGLSRQLERSRLDLGTLLSDTSTLITDLAETGIVRDNSHRRTAQADLSYTLMLAESRILFAQFSYSDVSYYGSNSSAFVGYRSPNVTVGEKFILSERLSLSLSAFGNRLYSDTRNGGSEQTGAQLGFSYAMSDVSQLDASLGSSRRTLGGDQSSGTVASASFTHDLSRGRLALSYSRNLVPNGFGVFVE
ncbi:MAG: hypothetical protein ABI885_10015, partial [Gammaproteobacteria bacterium]